MSGRFGRTSGAWLLLGLALGFLAACAGGGAGAPEEPIPDPAALAVPDPDLGEMEPALAAWLRQVREDTARRAAAGGDIAGAGLAFGGLGQLYHIFGFLDAAEVCYDNARRLVPGEFRWVYLLATVHLEKGSLEQAEAGFVRALELDPEAQAAWIRLGDARLDLDRPQDARTAFERALELAPESAAALFGLGQAAAAEDRPQEAAEHFERALEIQPQASVVRYPLSQAYRKLGRLDEAEEQIRRRGNIRVHFPDPPIDELSDVKTLAAFQVVQSLAADPTVPDQQLLGFALTHLGKVRGTAGQLERVLAERAAEPETDPLERARLHYVTGVLLVNQRDDAQAAEHFRAAVELAPGFADAHVKLGNALARGGRLAEAVEEFSRALEIEPGDRELRLKRATALLNLRRGGEALAELRALVAADPAEPTARIRLAEALEAGGDRPAAERQYRAALDAGLEAPAQARIHRAYAAFHRRGGRLEAAVEQYEEALARDRDLIGARIELAALLGHLGRLPEAAAQYAEVVGAQRDNESARLGEAAALILDGRRAEAAARLEEGVAVLPQSVPLVHLLARLRAAAPEAELRRGGQALELAQAAYEASPVPPHAETVAMAHAELGSFGEAAEWQGRVIRQLAGGPARQVAEQRLALYRAGTPYRAEAPEDLLGPPGGG